MGEPEIKLPDLKGAQEPNVETSLENKAAYLYSCIIAHIEVYTRRKQFHRLCAITTRVAAILISSLLMILLGTKSSGTNNYIMNIALILGASQAAIQSWEGFSNQRELWIKYHIVLHALLRLKMEYNYKITHNTAGINEKQLDALNKEYHQILDDANEAWKGFRQLSQQPQ